MDYFYDGQVRRYLTQFINILSNFAYKDGKGNIIQVPVRYGDISRQSAQILKKNSENAIPNAPFIACYIKDLQFDRPRMQDPTFVSKIQIRERELNTEDPENPSYLNAQGSNYTVERIMPSPYLITLAADIWSTSVDQKLQIWEQIVVFFNPSFEIQTTDNYIDWTSLSVLHLENQTWSSRTVPQGISEDIDVLTMTFTAPVWITPPAKVRKLGIITKIISNIFATGAQGTIQSVYGKTGATEIFNNISPDQEVIVTPGNYDLLVYNSMARLIHQNSQGDDIDLTDPRNSNSWHKILDLYPGKFRAGLSQLRFSQATGTETVAYVSLNPVDDYSMILVVDPDTIPTNTVIAGRGTIDAIVNPETFNPGSVTSGTRYLILEDINNNSLYGTAGFSGPIAWKNSDSSDFQAHANDIIEWDGTKWSVVFDSQSSTDIVYVTNSFTGIQYQWKSGDWNKSYEGVYNNKLWRLVL
jgi:hypothetical protein